MQPKAYLMIDQPKSLYRFMKYYLGTGDNIIGIHQDCQVVLPGTNYTSLPDYIANINLSDDLLLLESLSRDVYINSNLPLLRNKKINLSKNIQYVLPMEQYFYFGPFKAIVQMPEYSQLLQIGKIQNKHKFTAKKQLLKNQFDSTKISQNKLDNIEVKSDKTEEIIDEQFEMFAPTLEVNDGSYEPTMALQEHAQIVEDKINLSQYCEKISLSQQILLQSIKKNERKRQQPQILEQLSMPDTIIDGMPNTIIADDNQIMMPPTIQDEDQNNNQKINIDNKLKISKTINYDKKDKIEKRIFLSEQIMQINTSTDQVPTEPIKLIEDFMDLFGVQDDKNKNNNNNKMYISSLQNSNKISNIQNQIQQQKSIQIQKRINSFQENIEKIQNTNNNQQKNKQILSQKIIQNKLENQKQLKIVNVSNFKPKLQHRAILKKRGYQIVQQPNQQYQILIIGMNMKLTEKLMLALMHGKRIVNQKWLIDESYKMNGLIEGYKWQMIEKNMGHAGQILQDRFYLYEQLFEQYNKVIQCAGGILISENKNLKWNQNINIILNVNKKNHQNFYEEKKKYQKWKFYQYQMIIQSVLMGQQIMEKYRINDYSF